MVLTHPNQMDNTYLTLAEAFLAMATAAGFSGATLGVNPLSTLPGEIVNVLPQSKWADTPGFPTGDFPAAFVVNFSGAKPVDPDKWVNIGNCLFYMTVRGWSVAQVLENTAGLTPA
jgi:hypothetical protein